MLLLTDISQWQHATMDQISSKHKTTDKKSPFSTENHNWSHNHWIKNVKQQWENDSIHFRGHQFRNSTQPSTRITIDLYKRSWSLRPNKPTNKLRKKLCNRDCRNYSVPFWRRIRNCSGERIARHSSSDFWTEVGADGAAMASSSSDGRTTTSQWLSEVKELNL